MEKNEVFFSNDFSDCNVRVLAVADPAADLYRRGNGVTEIWEQRTGGHVGFESVPWVDYPIRLFEMLQSGKSDYDIFMVPGYFWLPKFVSENWVCALDDLVKENPETWKEYDFLDIHPGLKNELKYNDRLYLLPCFSEIQIVFYRKDILAAAGFRDIQMPLKSQDYFRIACATHNPPQIFGTHIKGGLAESFPEWLPWFSDSGGTLFSDNEEPAFNKNTGEQSLNYMLELSKFCGPDIQNSDNETIFYLLQEGRLAIINHWSGQISPILDKSKNPYAELYGFTHLKNPWGSIWSFALNPVSHSKQAAFSYLCWATCAENDKLQTLYSGSPTRLSTLNDSEWNKKYVWLPALNSALEARKQFPSFVQFFNVMDILYEMVNSILKKENPISIALRNASAACEKILDKKG